MPRKVLVNTKTEDFISIREAAKLVGKSVPTIHRVIKKGLIPAIQSRKRDRCGASHTYYLVKKADVIAWDVSPNVNHCKKPSPSFDGYLTTVQASRFIDVCATTILRAAKKGVLPFEKRPDSNKYGYCLVFREDDVRRWKNGEPIAAEIPEMIEGIDVVPKPQEAKAVAAGSLADFSNDELTAELVNRIKTAFNSGYQKGHAEGREEMKAAIMSAIEAL